MPFCPYCGAQLQPQHRFCPNCGKPVESSAPSQGYAPPPPAPVPQPQYAPQPTYAPQPAYAQPMGERVQTVIPNMKKLKFLGQWDSISVVVTDRRTIFAQLTGDMAKKAIDSALKDAKAQGKGFFDQWGSQMDASVNYWRRYLTMNPDDILREVPSNFAVEHSLLKEVKVNVHREKAGVQVMHHTEAEWKYPTGSMKLVCDGDVEDQIRAAYGGRAR